MNKVYLVGIEHDNFCNDDFSITAVCDSREKAKDMVSKTHETFPGADMKNITVRGVNINQFYTDWV